MTTILTPRVLRKEIVHEAAPKLQKIVSQIAAKHGLDLEKPGAYLRLQMAGHGQLVIQNIGGRHVSITHYIEVVHDLVADPQVVVFTAYRGAKTPEESNPPLWVPLESTELFNGWRLYAEPDADGRLLLYEPVAQVELARYCDDVIARNLRNDGWLQRASRRNVALRTGTDGERGDTPDGLQDEDPAEGA